MDKSRKKQQQLMVSLAGEICPGCGGPKQPRKSVCFTCWGKLPPSVGRATYRLMGRGYEQAFDAAMRALGVEKPHFPLEVRE